MIICPRERALAYKRIFDISVAAMALIISLAADSAHRAGDQAG